MSLMDIFDFLTRPWPWYVAGPLIGLVVPALLLLGNKCFGISGNLRTVCSWVPSNIAFFRFEWRREAWNLAFAVGILVGGFVGGVLLANPEPLRLAESTIQDLAAIGIQFDGNLVPAELFGLAALGDIRVLAFLLGGGALVGFGARWAGGCTSGHAISGLANLELPSLLAVVGFFAGGLLITFFVF